MDIQFIDTTQWQETFWLHSGGTREKRILLDSEDNLWYFKRSENKPGRNGNPDKYYKDEFWSEIIAYQIGYTLGLNILRYDVALSNGQIGCISPSMIDINKEQLVEVGRYMITYNPDFSPENNVTRNEYTYDLLSRTLDHFQLAHYKKAFLQTLIFDALIGNSDRHQENWAFISDSFNPDEDIDIQPMLTRIKKEKKFRYNDTLINKEFELRRQKIRDIAPIYDSGSSLGRELTEERVKKMLLDKQMLAAYITRGTSELHWNTKQKVSHITLVRLLKETEPKDLFEIASHFLKKWDENKIYNLITTLDQVLPDEHSFYKISPERKELIFKLLTLRFERITNILND
ncbi:HipA domain-containing protein [Sphingobacterium wenxiniae]|uniref:HipA-like C-terminal domain-containing protein n=1 Tax=Sphingobacterium wenxiniae TaxID=683125 RepID=A0A1I6U9V8_9SPHI|nr:hypothetical protein [Sphingobacterium wenxiniae]SFS98233.1 hypothetical protein SAMN05660206_10877 [Sphingobacterium wenxiniae]